MRIKTVAVVGVGAVGSYYGCRMTEAGHDVSFLLRSDYETVSESGFILASVHGDFRVEKPQIFKKAADIGPVDLVVLAWKTTANDSLTEVVRPLLHDKSKILTLQNGLGNVELLAEKFGEERVLGGLCFVCINRLSPGRLAHTAGGMVTVGALSTTDSLAELPTLFGPHVDLRLTDNLAEAQWRKLVWNIPFNGLCITEGGIDTEELLARPGQEERVLSLMKEVQAVANALGHEISDRFLANQVSITRPMGPYKPSSMLDYVNGYPLEVEAIWGEPVRRAQAAGVAVPGLISLYETIRQLDAER